MAIPLAFLSLTCLILWFVIGSKGHWALKAVVIAATLYLCVSIGTSLPDFAGWPSTAPLPDKFLVHWTVVKEPDKQTKKEGAIYIWETNLSADAQAQEDGWKKFLISFVVVDTLEPRVHKIPYTIEDHKTADGVNGRIKDGEIVIGHNNGGKGGDGKKGDGKGKGKKGKGSQEGSGKEGNGGGSFSLSRDVNFQSLPEPVLPDKN